MASARDAVAPGDLVRRIEEASHKIQCVVDRTERAASKMLLASAVRKRRQHKLRLQQQQQHEGGGPETTQSGANQQGGTPQALASAAASPSGAPMPCAEESPMSSAQFASPASPARTLSDASPSANMSPASARSSTRAQLQQLLQKSHRQLKGLIAAQRHDILVLAKALEEDKTTLRTSSAKTTTTADAAPALDAAAPELNVMQAQGKADTAHHFKTPPRPRAKKSGASQSRRAKIISLLKRHRSLSLQLSAQTAFASARDAGVNQDSITSDIRPML